jgi:hypothetical protein
MINIKNLDMALKIRQVIRSEITDHPISRIQGCKSEIMTPYAKSSVNQSLFIKKVSEYIMDYAKDKIINSTKIDRANFWILQMAPMNILKIIGKSGITGMYAAQLEKLGKKTLLQLVDVASLRQHILFDKASFVITAIKKSVPSIGAALSNINSVPDSPEITVLGDGLKYKKINIQLKSSEIREILDNISHNTNTLNPPKLRPHLDKGILTQSYAYNSKLTSIRHRNIMLRLICGDIFCNERLHRFKLVESNKCIRCNMVETPEHLLIDCEVARNMWLTLRYILSDIGIDFEVTLENVLNLGNHYMDPSIMSIVAQLNSINISCERPRDIPHNRITGVIKSLLEYEKNNAYKTNSWRKFNKFWKKFENIVYD